jgi:hypothetical protein
MGYDTRNVIKLYLLKFVRFITCSRGGVDLNGDGKADVIALGCCCKSLKVSTKWEKERELYLAVKWAYHSAKATKPSIDLLDDMLSTLKSMKNEEEADAENTKKEEGVDATGIEILCAFLNASPTCQTYYLFIKLFFVYLTGLSTGNAWCLY